MPSLNPRLDTQTRDEKIHFLRPEVLKRFAIVSPAVIIGTMQLKQKQTPLIDIIDI